MIPVQNTAPGSAFQFWLDRTNEMANYFTTCVITTDANNSTSTAVGNAAITGTFNSAALWVGGSSVNVNINASSLAISNSTVNTGISIPTASQYTNNFCLAANGKWTFVPISNNALTLSGTNIKEIDAYSMTQYTAAEYIISIVDTDANNRYVTKVLTTHDTNNALITEYASFTTNNVVGVINVTSNSTHVKLNYIPALNNYNVKFVRTVI